MKLGFWEVALGLNPTNTINKNGFKRRRNIDCAERFGAHDPHIGLR